MQFRVLSCTVAAWHDGEELSLGRRQERCLLGLLLLNAGLVVSADHLVDQLWPEGPPTSGRRTLQTYVARLRGLLAPYGVQIITQGAGYSIGVDRDQIDVHRFTAQIARARDIADPLVRAEALTSALDLWRGPVLAGVADDDLSGRLSTGLEETRLAAGRARGRRRYAAGRHADAVGTLTDLVAEHPTRERFAALLMLALYRCRRSADATSVYRRFRGALVAEVGLEPTHELLLRHQLHRQILNNAPELATPEQRRRRFLPRDIPDFTGWGSDLATLDAFARNPSQSTTVVISAIAGLGGVGKTALAVRVCLGAGGG